MLLSAGIFHLIQTKKISKQEFKQEAQNYRLIARTNEGKEPLCAPLLPGPTTPCSRSVVTFSLYGIAKGSQLSKSGRALVKSKGEIPPKPIKLFGFYI